MLHNATLKELINKYDAFILDKKMISGKDGINKQILEAVELIASKRIIIFVCNIACSSEKLQESFKSIGLYIPAEQILTSGDLAKTLLCDAKHPLIGRVPTIYHFGDNDFFKDSEEVLKKIILQENIKEASICLITKTASANEPLEPYINILKQAVETDLVAVCADPTISYYRDNVLFYRPGYFTNIYKELGGRVIYAGKPDKVILYQALIKLARNNIKDKASILLLANDYENDVVGAFSVGIDSAIILNQNNYQLFSNLRFNTLNHHRNSSEEIFDIEARPNYMVDLS
jgi:HAD superfamily hydrolase (TIGR01459 family)